MTYPQLDERTEKALQAPVGMASPLWWMIGGAAMAGAAVFWATRWMRPTNLEAVLPEPKATASPEPDLAGAVETVAEPAVKAAEAMGDAIVETAESLAEAAKAAVEAETLELVIDPVTEAPVLVAVEPAGPDDLTVMTGIGPKLAAVLAERGITRFEQIAAWTDDEVAALDKELKLMGRVARDAWVEQAKRLA